MHGRKRVPVSEAHKIERAKRAKVLKAEIEKITECLTDTEKRETLVHTATQILSTLDDFATIWNWRKQFFLEDVNPETLKRELLITNNVLYGNPKGYWAWHHRRFCIDKVPEYDCQSEVSLCDTMLARDSRNFHAWRHRRWAVAKCGDIYDSELSKSVDLIATISNFSAWHYRSQLPNLPPSKVEIDWAKTACWMDANDQSAWIYYRWLIHREDVKDDVEFLKAEFAQMCELMEDSPDSKYPYLAGIWLQRQMPEPVEATIATLKGKLRELDPIRAPYYDEQ
jgi:geranylgeranyl transferase type-2 subunit alpha